MHASDDEGFNGHLVHHDPGLFREASADGRALVVEVKEVADLGSGRSTVPVWVVQFDSELLARIRENTRVVPYQSRGHQATVTAIRVLGDHVELQLEWITRKTIALNCGIGARPADNAWTGELVPFVIADAADLTRRRSQRVWTAKDGPGAWLTHGKAPSPVQIADDEGVDLLVDDVTQITEEPA